MGDIDTRYFPIFADIDRRPCVVAGEGPTAEKRIRQLLKYGGDVIVFTPAPSEWLILAEAEGKLTIERRPFVRGDLHGAFLAVCATDDPDVRRAIVSESESTGCLLSVTNDAAASSYILPSITHRDPIQIGVSTAGAAPELAKRLRRLIETTVSEAWGPWVRLVASVRGRILAATEDEHARAVVMNAVLADSVLTRLEAGEQLDAEEFLALAPAPPEGTDAEDSDDAQPAESDPADDDAS